jgi:hypothetical protein
MPASFLPNVLFLAHRVPYPPNKGDRIRSFHLLRFLSRRARVHLACLADELICPRRRPTRQCQRPFTCSVGAFHSLRIPSGHRTSTLGLSRRFSLTLDRRKIRERGKLRFRSEKTQQQQMQMASVLLWIGEFQGSLLAGDG